MTTSSNINEYTRATRAEIRRIFRDLLNELNQLPGGQIDRKDILSASRDIVERFEPHVVKVEEFVLSAINEEWAPGVGLGISLAGDWISMSKRLPAQSIRFAQGAPALLAGRLLILGGAKSVLNGTSDPLREILTQPIEVEDSGYRFSHLPFPERLELFYPEALLGYADLIIQYLGQLWSRHSHLHAYFDSEEEYLVSLGQFLMLVALIDGKREEPYPLYPGYRLLHQAPRSMAQLCAKLANRRDYREKIAAAFGETLGEFDANWEVRASKANSAQLGTNYIFVREEKFPIPLSSNVPNLW
ncbi:MAG: hypothetical protein HW403_741 [Dehalococcoidia bacterium]|nr:hypothetical protein [Dehalococcoidia bacterium]